MESYHENTVDSWANLKLCTFSEGKMEQYCLPLREQFYWNSCVSLNWFKWIRNYLIYNYVCAWLCIYLYLSTKLNMKWCKVLGTRLTARGPELAGVRESIWNKRWVTTAHLGRGCQLIPYQIPLEKETYLLVIINISVLLIMTWVKYLYFANLPFSMT